MVSATPSVPDNEPLLSVIVPVYNERSTINELIHRVLAAPYSKQLVVIDDGSTDGTINILETWRGHPEVNLLYHSHNRGKGAAIRTGLHDVRGQFTIIQDADLEYDPQDFPALIGPLLKGEVQVVYGSRYLSGDNQIPTRALIFRWGVALLNVTVRILYGIRLSDEATCYKAFPTDLLKSLDLRCERFEFCPEVTAKICRMGLAIREVPIHYCARTKQSGKKIRLRDGLAALQTLWKWRNWRPKGQDIMR
jgi:dolichol-phosphate mannosyltransferase